MCGIFGWVRHKTPLSTENLENARRMTDLLRHRGPDHGDEWTNTHVFMGHRRLSIIDLSAAANQPFTDPTGRYVLCFNGELYNYVELREELEREGIAFRTKSDTEVMLAALIHWKDAALCRFDGMFAAALHDRRTGRHFVFRDPLGQKPLYYFRHEDGVVYASELRSILGLPGFRWRIDKDSFRRFLMNGYYAGEGTPVSGIRKLLPGCALEVAGGQVRVTRYWDSMPGEDELDISADEAAGEFSRLFSGACMRTMRSDVPYGVFLSGGIDSSLILDFCHDINPSIRSFTVAMGDHDFDESAKAETVARHLGIKDHHSFSMDTGSVVSAMADVLAASDEPHGDPGFVNAYFLAKASRPHLTVALAGDGGDELFAGYLPFAGLGIAPFLKALPGPLLGLVKAARRLIPETDRYLGLRFKADAYLRGFPATDATRFPLWLASMDPEEAVQVCGAEDPGFFDRFGATASVFGPMAELVAPAANRTPTQQFLYFYQKVFLPEFVCMHTDRAAMQFGLEVRSPFLSPDLVAFANRLPDRLKLGGGKPKRLLKKVAKDRGLPKMIVDQKKQGFTFPLARWLKSSLKPTMTDLLGPDEWEADGLVDMAVAGRLMDAHLSGRRNHYRLLYNLMCFRAWRRKFPEVTAP